MRVLSLLASGNPGIWTVTQTTDANRPKALDALLGIIDNAMAQTALPGLALAVVSSDKILYVSGSRVRSLEQAALVDADTVFQLASISKPVGATVISRALSKGQLSSQKKVVDYLPWFRMGDDFISNRVTLADLYTHRIHTAAACPSTRGICLKIWVSTGKPFYGSCR